MVNDRKSALHTEYHVKQKEIKRHKRCTSFYDGVILLIFFPAHHKKQYTIPFLDKAE